MPEQRRTGMTRTNVLETLDGTIRIKARWPRKDWIKGPPDLPPGFRGSKELETCLDALQVLQCRRTQPLLGETLGVALRFVHASLPRMVRHDVSIVRPVRGGLWAALSGMHDRISPGALARARELAAELPRREYHFWPADVGRGDPDDDGPPHWALVVLHVAHRPAGEVDGDPGPRDELPDAPYNHLESFAVITPDHGNAARELEDEVADVLLKLLPRLGIQVGEDSVRQSPWVPPRYVSISLLSWLMLNAPQLMRDDHKEYWSSGIRVFEMIRIWLDRLTEMYCQNPYVYDSARFWGAHPGWINLDAVRSNMIGMAAAMVNRAMDGTTRVAIEPILDHEMVHVASDETIPTQSMAPDRQDLGAFVPDQSRRNPTWLRDDAASSSISVREMSNDDGRDGNEDGEDDG